MKKKMIGTILVLCILLAFVPYVQAADNIVSITGTSALTDDGTLYMWGYNYYGQVGIGSDEDYIASPVKVMEDVKFVKTYGDTTYAIKMDGTLWAWGYNRLGEIGNGTTEDSFVPVKILDDVKVIVEQGFVLKTDDALWGWGYYPGDGSEQSLLPVKISDNVEKFYRSGFQRYIINKDGSLCGWGQRTKADFYNWSDVEYLGIGDGTDETRLIPVKILDNVKKICVSELRIRSNSSSIGDIMPYVAYAIKNDNTLWRWGYASYTNSKTVLTPVKVKENIKDIIARNDGLGSCPAWYITTTDDTLWSWGNNEYYDLGVEGDYIYFEDCKKIISNIKELCLLPYNNFGIYYAGATYAISSDNSLWGWGADVGFTEDGEKRISPTKLVDNFKCLEYYSNCYFLLKTDGTLWKWGEWINDEERNFTLSKVMDDVKDIQHSMELYILKNDESLWMIDSPYSNNPVQLLPKTQEPSFTITNENSTAKITNTSEEQQSATVIVAEYNDNRLLQVFSNEITFNPNETKIYDTNNNTRVFVWDSLKGMRPLNK